MLLQHRIRLDHRHALPNTHNASCKGQRYEISCGHKYLRIPQRVFHRLYDKMWLQTLLLVVNVQYIYYIVIACRASCRGEVYHTKTNMLWKSLWLSTRNIEGTWELDSCPRCSTSFCPSSSAPMAGPECTLKRSEKSTHSSYLHSAEVKLFDCNTINSFFLLLMKLF